MDSDTEKLFLSNIFEYVVDEEKLISYLWLSKILSVHVNYCKILLQKFVEEYKQKYPHNPLNVSFIISGMRHDDKAVTSIVDCDDLEKVSSEYKIMFFKHIYSVKKSSNKVDQAALVNLNSFKDYEAYVGKISNTYCTRRPEEVMCTLRTKSYEAIIKQESKTSEKNSLKNHLKQDIKKSSPTKSPRKLSPKKSPKKPDSKSNQKQNGIVSMFAAQSTKSREPTNIQDSKKPKNIANFFNNQPVKTIEKKITKTENKVKTEISSPKKEEQKNNAENKSKVEEKKIKKEQPSPKKEVKKKINKKGKMEKNRKRVLQLSDSEDEMKPEDPFSDGENEVKMEKDDDDEDVIPATPVSTPKVSVTSAAINPRKRRKIVDKTYTDEEGYILTKKVEVYESCSEDESEIKENIVEDNKICETKVDIELKQPQLKGKKKISPPTKGKQATLTSFFSRKG